MSRTEGTEQPKAERLRNQRRPKRKGTADSTDRTWQSNRGKHALKSAEITERQHKHMANREEPAAFKWVVPQGSAGAAPQSATEQTRRTVTRHSNASSTNSETSLSRKSSTTFFDFLLDDMKGGEPDEPSMTARTWASRAPTARSTIAFYVQRSTFSQLLSPYFCFSIFSSSSFRPFRNTAHSFCSNPFSDLNFLNCARDSISNWIESRGAMKGCSDTWNHGHPEKFSPDHQGPGFLSKPFFDAPLPRIFA